MKKQIKKAVIEKEVQQKERNSAISKHILAGLSTAAIVGALLYLNNQGIKLSLWWWLTTILPNLAAALWYKYQIDKDREEPIAWG